jgi:hypothetical protein
VQPLASLPKRPLIVGFRNKQLGRGSLFCLRGVGSSVVKILALGLRIREQGEFHENIDFCDFPVYGCLGWVRLGHRWLWARTNQLQNQQESVGGN